METDQGYSSQPAKIKLKNKKNKSEKKPCAVPKVIKTRNKIFSLTFLFII